LNKEEPEEIFIGRYVFHLDDYGNLYMKRGYYETLGKLVHDSDITLDMRLERKDVDKIVKLLDEILTNKLEIHGVK
jgi:hypothetical protein